MADHTWNPLDPNWQRSHYGPNTVVVNNLPPKSLRKPIDAKFLLYCPLCQEKFIITAPDDDYRFLGCPKCNLLIPRSNRS